jgi:uroporphyrinogen III methyltransferase/synthase
MTMGKVYLVGAGCGDYDLISLRGMHHIKECDVLVYDSLIDSRLLDYANENCEKISVGKRAGRHSASQEEINNILVEKALSGKTVVRLKGGDPFVFGRGGEEIISLKENNIPYSIVPGISSGIAVPELAGVPVTHRKISRSFTVMTGHTAEDLLPENLSAYGKIDGTLVVLMGLRNLEKIAQGLILGGKSKDTAVAVISNGATGRAKIVRGTLENIYKRVNESEVASPATIVVGETADFDFAPTIDLPLKGVSITITGTKKFSTKLNDRLYELGGDVKRLDYLKVRVYENNSLFDDAIKNIENYSTIALTSINGAEIFFKKLRELKLDIRKLSHITFGVIGSGTGKVLENHGIFPELLPKEYTSSALGRLIAENAGENDRVLILRAENGSPELTKILSENKVCYDDIKIYDVENSKSSPFEVRSDFLTFASSSGVKNFFKSGYTISHKTRIVCIGDITAKALRKQGINNYIVSPVSDTEGIVLAIIQEVKSGKIKTIEKQ